MANLETLELRISANAQEATRGLGKLISSLSALSDAIIKPYADLRDFNEELKKLKSMSKIKITIDGKQAVNEAKTTAKKVQSVIKASRGAILEEFKDNFRKGTFESWMYGPRPPINIRNNLGFQDGYKTEEERRAKNPQWYIEEGSKEWVEGIRRRNEALRKQLEQSGFKNDDRPLAENSVAIKDLAESMYKYSEAADDARTKTGRFRAAFDSFKNGINKLKEGLSNFAPSALVKIEKAIERIKRIAVNMMIRKAIRALGSALKEGVQNVYEWSKTVNGSFADSVKSIKASALTLKNSLGAMITPVIQALIPLFNALSQAIITAANWLNQFISLLSGQTSWIMATQQEAENMDNLADSTANAGKAAKETLAAFDELNVISSGSGSGGGGNTLTTETDYGSMFEEIDKFDKKIRDLADFIKTNIESITKLAGLAGAALLAWDLGTAFKEVLPTLATVFGYVATGATIALTIGLNWLFQSQYLDTGEEGWLWAAVLSTAVGSTVAGTIAKTLIGGNAGLYAAAITLELSATTDIVANIENSDVSALSEESILTNIKAAIEAGAGIALIETAAGAGFTSILTAAAGGALIVFGVAMGLKTVFNKKDIEWDSEETIIGALTAAIPVGIGLFVLGTGAIPAVIAAIATFGVIVALKASIPKDKIEWGDIELTDEQVQEYVGSQMFDIDVRATISVIADQVEMNTTQRSKIGEDLAHLLPTYNLIMLGLADDQDYTTMKSQIDALIGTLDDYIEQARNTGKLTLTYMPTLAGDSSVEQGTWFTDYNQGWDKIQEFVSAKGKQIGEWLTEQEKKEIKDATPDVIKEAMDQLTAVTNAMAQAKISANAFADFNIDFGKITLGDVTEETFSKIATQFEDYREQLRAEYTALANEQYTLQASLVAGLLKAYGEDDPAYLAALEELRMLGENMPKAIEDGVNAASASGTNLITDWLNEQLGGSAITWDWADAFERTGIASAEDMQGALRQVLESSLSEEQLNLADLVGFTGWDLLSDELKNGFLEYVDIFNPEQLDWLKQSGIPVSDVIRFSGFDKLEEDARQQLVTALTNAYGSQQAIEDIKKVIPNISADGLIKLTNWDDVVDKQGFIDAMKKEFGDAETIAALKKIGVDISSDIDAGIDSNPPNAEVTSSFAKDAGPDKLKGELKDLKGNAIVSAAVDPNATPTKAVTDNVDAYNKDTNKTKAHVEADVASTSIPKTLFDALMTQYNGDAEKVKAEIKACIEAGNDPTSLLTNEITSYNKDDNKKSAKFKTAIDSKNDIEDSMKSGIASYEDNMKTANFKSALEKNFGVTDEMKAKIKTYNDKPGTTKFKTAQKKGYGFEDWQKKYQKTDPSVSFKVEASNLKDFSLSFAQAVFQAIKAKLNGSKVTIGQGGTLNLQENVSTEKSIGTLNIDLNVSNLNNFSETVGKAVSGSVQNSINNVQMPTILSGNVFAAQTKASGGIVSADLFIANENGKSEMIGRFGNQTAVANQEQMVEAMARGVSYAQEEQNSLLREQNRLLQGILQKEGTVSIGASSALGRTVKQSLNMYNALVGG